MCILNNHYPQNQSLKHLYLYEDSTSVLCATMSHESFNICKRINCILTLVVTPDQYPLVGCVCPGTGPVTKGDNSWSAGWRSSTLRTKACRLECRLKAMNKNTFTIQCIKEKKSWLALAENIILAIFYNC